MAMTLRLADDESEALRRRSELEQRSMQEVARQAIRVIYLTLAELLHVAERTLGPDYAVRDYGLLEAAVARPQATVFGKDAYPDLDSKAAALLHSVARNHALIDGNKRLALTSVIAFYGLNGRRLTLTNDAAYDLVMAVAAGEVDSVDEIAAVLRRATRPFR
jgi:death-on-curing protein